MKYIVFHSQVSGDFPIVFPEHIDHYLINNAIHNEYPGIKAVSAGFCDSWGNAFGESNTLHLKPAKGDTVLIQKLLTE